MSLCPSTHPLSPAIDVTGHRIISPDLMVSLAARINVNKVRKTQIAEHEQHKANGGTKSNSFLYQKSWSGAPQ